ncbi:MAG: thioredoxin [Proteobacteria bacterium]|nr:thioredoxin [Pseudomonadota bacterium]
MATLEVTDDSFESDVLGAEGPVLVDFWAQWCGPCLQVAPSLEELSDEIDGLTIAKLDIDSNPMAPTRYGVRGIPTMVLFKDGEAIATKVGALPKGAIADWLQSNLDQ